MCRYSSINKRAPAWAKFLLKRLELGRPHFKKFNLFQVGLLSELCCAVDDGERVLNGLLHLSVHLVAGVARAEVGDLVGAAAVVVARRVLRGQRDQGGGWKQVEDS